MALKKDNYPMVGFRYEVSIIPQVNGSGLGNIGSIASSASTASEKTGFSEISGVSVTLETEVSKDANGKTIESPTGVTYSPLVLKRGLTGVQSELMSWVAAALLTEKDGVVEIIKKTVVVNLLSDLGTPIMSWVFVGAHPTKWSVSGLKAMSNELVVEELELKYDRFLSAIYGV